MTAKEKRSKAVELILSRIRKNSYTQGAKRSYVFGYPDNVAGNKTQSGYGDCSSTVRKCIKAAAGIDIGSNTSSQIDNRGKGKIVHEPKDAMPDESRYLPGDCLYFKGNNAHSLGVGHVEMYTGNGKCTGHGSGTGPNTHDMKAYCKERKSKGKGLFMVIRWITEDGSDGDGFSVLRKGDHGERVTEVQSMLLQLGYDLGKYGMDGDYGSATESAVKAFQTNTKLSVTGNVDEVTLLSMKALMESHGDSDEDAEDVKDNTVGDLTVKDGTWNVRTAPYTDADVAMSVRGGTALEEIVTEWIPVKIGGRALWISNKAVIRNENDKK